MFYYVLVITSVFRSVMPFICISDQEMRLSVLYKFLQDYNHVYSDLTTIRLMRFVADEWLHYSKKMRCYVVGVLNIIMMGQLLETEYNSNAKLNHCDYPTEVTTE
jgi:hypothetical protein